MLAAELKSEPSVAATQLPNRDSSTRKVVSSVGVHIHFADVLIRSVVIDRKEMYMGITGLRQLTRLETRQWSMLPFRSLTVAHCICCESTAGAELVAHVTHV